MIDTKEFEAVLQLNADYKEKYALDKIKAQQALYIIEQEQEPYMLEDTQEDEEGNISVLLPIFSAEEFANYYISKNNLTNAKVIAIKLDVYKKSWALVLNENKVLLAIMPADKDSLFNVKEPLELNEL